MIAERVFRHAGGCLIDTPDLTPPAPSTAGEWPYAWIATLWPDPGRRDGWAALEWAPGPRGWRLPASLAIGDVVEFGITWSDQRRGVPGPTERWFGWLDHATDRALIIHGPYPTPADAHAAAQPAIDEVRLTQLDPPAAPTEYVPS